MASKKEGLAQIAVAVATLASLTLAVLTMRLYMGLWILVMLGVRTLARKLQIHRAASIAFGMVAGLAMIQPAILVLGAPLLGHRVTAHWVAALQALALLGMAWDVLARIAQSRAWSWSRELSWISKGCGALAGVPAALWWIAGGEVTVENGFRVEEIDGRWELALASTFAALAVALACAPPWAREARTA